MCVENTPIGDRLLGKWVEPWSQIFHLAVIGEWWQERIFWKYFGEQCAERHRSRESVRFALIFLDRRWTFLGLRMLLQLNAFSFLMSHVTHRLVGTSHEHTISTRVPKQGRFGGDFIWITRIVWEGSGGFNIGIQHSGKRALGRHLLHRWKVFSCRIANNGCSEPRLLSRGHKIDVIHLT